MHQHTCRYCERVFVCDQALNCFAGKITCDECFWKHDVPHFLLFCAAAIAVIGLTIFLFNHR